MPSEPDSLHTLLLFDSMSDAIVTFNRSMRIELFNRAAEARFQCARAEVVGGGSSPRAYVKR